MNWRFSVELNWGLNCADWIELDWTVCSFWSLTTLFKGFYAFGKPQKIFSGASGAGFFITLVKNFPLTVQLQTGKTEKATAPVFDNKSALRRFSRCRLCCLLADKASYSEWACWCCPVVLCSSDKRSCCWKNNQRSEICHDSHTQPHGWPCSKAGSRSIRNEVERFWIEVELLQPIERFNRGRNFWIESNFFQPKIISKKIPLAPGYFSLEPDRTFCTIESNRCRTCSDRGRTFSDRGRTFRNVLILGDFEPFFWVKLGSFWGHFIIVLHRFGVVLFNALAFLEREKARRQRQFAIAFIFSMPQYVAARRSKAPPQPQLNFTQANSNAGVSDKALRRGAKTASWPFAIVCFQKPAKCFSHANYHIHPLQKSVWDSNSECF